MVTGSGLRVRPRQDADLPGLMPVLQRAHEEQGYPKRACAIRPDWLAVPDELGVWVAEAMSRVPVLLVDPAGRALGFYRRRGWREIGTSVQHWGEHRVEAVLMVGPTG